MMNLNELEGSGRDVFEINFWYLEELKKTKINKSAEPKSRPKFLPNTSRLKVEVFLLR